MSDNFAFLLPIMMTTFGCAFLLVWRWGARPALFWGAGYLCSAAGFCVPVVAPAMPGAFWGPLADLLFATAFLLYGQALADRLARPRLLLKTRFAIWALSILACCYAVLALETLRGELIASDVGCLLLIGIPAAALARGMKSGIDRALFGVVCLVILDSLIRVTTVFWTAPAGDGSGFLASDYAFLMQVFASVVGLLLALTALAAVTLDIIAGYRHEAVTDPLSGMLNRRGFEQAMAQRAPGTVASGTIVICDIDHFKQVNDCFGHATGDRVIVALAEIVRRHTPRGAIAARFGGEEFVVYLPSDAAAAARFANAVRLAFAGHDWRTLAIDRAMTASFGMSAVRASDASLEEAIGRADEGLYEAKAAGRNRVAVKRALAPTELAMR